MENVCDFKLLIALVFLNILCKLFRNETEKLMTFSENFMFNANNGENVELGVKLRNFMAFV